MNSRLVPLIFLSVLVLKSSAQKFVSKTEDIFGTRVFIENRGQFNSSVPDGAQIKFAYENSDEHIYFTPQGPVYRLIKRHPFTERMREADERGKKLKLKPDDEYFVNVKWIGANENIVIEESEKQNHYFTYGGPELNSATYKKITYKNVYNNIDIEYAFDEHNHGIKYNVLLHAGANPSDIKIEYSGDVRKIVKRGENIVIKTPLEDITEHNPLCYSQDQQKIQCDFILSNDLISFSFPQGIPSGEIVIDPWVTTISTLTSGNYAYDVDYDASGNLFVYGGVNQAKVAKYDPSGNLLWTFSGVVPSISWTSQGVGNSYLGNFIVNRLSGKTYIGQGYEPSGGTRIVRIDASGNYDNWVTPILFSVEVWDFTYYCGSDRLYELGGATITNLSGGIVNQATSTVQVANFTGIPTTGQDILSSAIDDQGVIFAIMASLGTPTVSNKMLRINNAFNGFNWFMPSTYNTFFEATNKSSYVGGTYLSNGYNCLAVNNDYLYYYDGFNVAAYDKNTGIKLGFTAIGANAPKEQGGIAVDDCNNVYVGGISSIDCYNFNGTTFTSLSSIPLNAPTPNAYVYDIKLNRNTNSLYVCGSGFLGIYSAIHSLNCGNIIVNTSCAAVNNGIAVASFTPSVPNPTINYIWTSPGSTVATTMNTSLTTNSVNLSNGTYTLFTQVNFPCGPTYITTVNIACCPVATMNSSVTLSGCSYSVNSATITVSGGGTLIPTATWSPQPASVSGNSLSASGIPPGTETVNVSFGPGCGNTYTFIVLAQAPPVSFTVNNLTGSNSITCLSPVVNMQAVSNYTFGTLSYSWTSPSFTAGTSTVSISQPNSLLVTVEDPLTGCLSQQTVVIGINTIQPTSTVTPASQAVTCFSNSPVTFTGTISNPTANIQQDWYSPLNPPPGGVPIATSNSTISLLSASIPPGVYTVQATNLVNGCKTIRTVTVTSLDAWPTFSLNSSTNFSIGCSPLNQTTLSIINPVSTQTPPATTSYTFLPPGFGGVVTPSIVLGANTSTVTQIPGTWTLIVQDNSNFCRTELSVPIIQNTVAPNVSASVLTQTLTCYNPTVLATATSTTSNTQLSWILPVTPPALPSPTFIIGSNTTGPNTSTSSLNYASFTVVATNTLNACSSNSVVVINQNFRPPVSTPTISIGTATAIYCTAATNPVVLTTGNSTTTSGGGPTAFVANPCWAGPSPQTSTCGASSYSCYVAGIYSLTVMDNYNGCTSTGTIQVIDKTQPPVLMELVSTATLDCGASHAQLIVPVNGSTAGLKYWYTMYPDGAAFSPTDAIVSNGNPVLSGTSSSSVSVSLSGIYSYIVTNTLTGCKASGAFSVVPGGLDNNLSANPQQGYAPLTVGFTASNNNGISGVNYIWNFSNGSAQTGSSNVAGATYTAAGIYTVVLIAQKGSCIDTVYQTIKVELPSSLETPNVFTPNGDGSNDFFILKTANITRINCSIFDRWGNKVYETASSTGNILWDGKNLQGKECAVGVYFYVLTADGGDDQQYTQKGQISLFR
jgi:gliding motility-associated-like protein